MELVNIYKILVTLHHHHCFVVVRDLFVVPHHHIKNRDGEGATRGSKGKWGAA